MIIENAKYNTGAMPSDNTNACISATIDGVISSVPLNEANRHYQEIMRLVAAGELTIVDAD